MRDAGLLVTHSIVECKKPCWMLEALIAMIGGPGAFCALPEKGMCGGAPQGTQTLALELVDGTRHGNAQGKEVVPGAPLTNNFPTPSNEKTLIQFYEFTGATLKAKGT
eukprot:5349288-Amphidinium_carterae.1